jgi:hypothetical protein
MCIWKSRNCKGVRSEEFPSDWQEIMKQVEGQDKRIDVRMEPCPCERYLEAAKMYRMEKVGLHELVSWQMPDSPESAEAPWD